MKHPWKEFPLNIIEVCTICELDHATQLCPSLLGIKATLQAIGGEVESTYFLPQNKPWKPQTLGTNSNFSPHLLILGILCINDLLINNKTSILQHNGNLQIHTLNKINTPQYNGNLQIHILLLGCHGLLNQTNQLLGPKDGEPMFKEINFLHNNLFINQN